MVAEDHAESKTNAGAIYKLIREPLISKAVPAARKLPLVYVVDSILKNVKGKYIPVIEQDANTWLPIVFQELPDDQRVKLKKVYDLWKDVGIFSEVSWRQMGASFSGLAADTMGQELDPKLEEAGITSGVSDAKDTLSVSVDVTFKYRWVILMPLHFNIFIIVSLSIRMNDRKMEACCLCLN